MGLRGDLGDVPRLPHLSEDRDDGGLGESKL